MAQSTDYLLPGTRIVTWLRNETGLARELVVLFPGEPEAPGPAAAAAVT